MRSVAFAAVALLVFACSPGAARAPASTSPAAAATFEQLRSRQLHVPTLSAGANCPSTALKTVKLTGATVPAHGQGPFYFGPWGPGLVSGDRNKVPWAVDPTYPGRLVVRGRWLNGSGVVAFGFWPLGFGTPAERADVATLFRKPDSEGRTVVYQAELDVDPVQPPSWRGGGHLWSFPAGGCYAIVADGDTFTETTVVSVGP